MKCLNDYISEALVKKHMQENIVIPNDRDDLLNIIVDSLLKGKKNLNFIDVSEITDMTNLFFEINRKIQVREIDISKWDVHNVKSMYGMFFNCWRFKSDLKNWDVSNVENMKQMFYDCNDFTSDLSEWDVSKVKDMEDMFFNCNSFDSDLSKWNVKNVKNMDQMFDYCGELNKKPDWYKNEKPEYLYI